MQPSNGQKLRAVLYCEVWFDNGRRGIHKQPMYGNSFKDSSVPQLTQEFFNFQKMATRYPNIIEILVWRNTYPTHFKQLKSKPVIQYQNGVWQTFELDRRKSQATQTTEHEYGVDHYHLEDQLAELEELEADLERIRQECEALLKQEIEKLYR